MPGAKYKKVVQFPLFAQKRFCAPEIYIWMNEYIYYCKPQSYKRQSLGARNSHTVKGRGKARLYQPLPGKT